MRHVVCQHCPELLEFIHGSWCTAPVIRSAKGTQELPNPRAGASHCPGTRIAHKPMPEINVHA